MEEAAFSAGTLAGAGSFRCEECGFTVALNALDKVPTCPSCGSQRFSRASMFVPQESFEPQGEEPDREDPDWLEDVCGDLHGQQGHYIAFSDGDRVTIFPLTSEWTRIGRSIAADIRLDDPTVSRRHAIIVSQPDGVRLLDDRSLNGVFVNSERVEWCSLSHSDRIVIGRYELFFIDATADQHSAEKLEGREIVA